MSIVDTVKQTAEPIVKEFGLDLWDVEFKKEEISEEGTKTILAGG